MDLYCIQLVLSRSTPHLNLIACRKPGINTHNDVLPLERSVCILWLNLKRGQRFVRLPMISSRGFFSHQILRRIVWHYSVRICPGLSGLNLISVIKAHSHRAKVELNGKIFFDICRFFLCSFFGFSPLSLSVNRPVYQVLPNLQCVRVIGVFPK